MKNALSSGSAILAYDEGLPSLTSRVGKLPRPWMAMTSFIRSLSLFVLGEDEKLGTIGLKLASKKIR